MSGELPSCKIFVGSLPNDISDEVLRSEFCRYGDVEEVFVKPGCEVGRQWAMVKFATMDQAQHAKESCDRTLTFPGAERPCDVMLAKNQGLKGTGGSAYPPGGGGGYVPPASNGYSAPTAYHPPSSGGGGVAGTSGSPARKIFVGSLPDGIAEATLYSEFAKYGSIEDIYIKPGCESGRQWAFVNFMRSDDAAHAVHMTNGVLQFAGSVKACEVTLARHQGMYGQDPLVSGPGATTALLPSRTPAPAPGYEGHGQPEAAGPRKIFVGSLPDNITETALQAEFSRYGQITDHFLKANCEPGRQWAFITYASSEQAAFAKESCDRVLMLPGSERPCEVTMARHQGLFGKDSDESGYDAAPPNSSHHGGHYAPPVVDGPKKIFVGSLPDTVTENNLRVEFSKYGQITDVFLKQGQESGRGWAFITFSSAEQASTAKESTDRVLYFPGSERACEVTLARNQGKFGQGSLNQYGAAGSAGQYSHGGGHGGHIAAEPSQPPPPATPPPAHLTPWRMYRTASGLPYYHNHSTGVTQWEAPRDFQVPGQSSPYGSPAPSKRYSPY